MNTAAVREIIDQYAKHGWILRRVLLSGALGNNIAEEIFCDAEIEAREYDGLWFSRRSKAGCEAWELRRLGGTPFALVVVIDDSADAAEHEEMLQETEERMFESDARPANSH